MKGMPKIWLAGMALALSPVAPVRAAALEQAQATQEAPLLGEARAFMEAYGRDLRAGDREGIAARYDRRGAFMMGAGRKTLMSQADLAAVYRGERWQPPAAFEWRDLSFEPLGPDAVAVVGLFAWTRAAGGAPRIFSYTALLIRQDGTLRIRIEDEDPLPAPAPPPAQ